MSHYLVTGGAGFIGSHLADTLLSVGHKVTVLDDLSTGKAENLSPRAMLVQGSVTDAALVKTLLAACDGCFHLAAIASVERANRDWVAAHQVNLTGAITVLDAARARKLPVVYASSAAIFGACQIIPLAETMPPQPLSAYGADKSGVELHARAGWTVHGIPSVGLRFFNVYGPRQDAHSPYSGVISIFADRLGAGHAITIFGDGAQTRDFVFVDDAVEALIRSMMACSRAASVFNVCTGTETSLLTLAAIMGGILQAEPRIMFAPARAGDITRSVGDPSLLQARLGFKPAIGLEEGLRRMLQR